MRKQVANCRKLRIKLATNQANFACFFIHRFHRWTQILFYFFINHGKHRTTRKKEHFRRIIPCLPWCLKHFSGSQTALLLQVANCRKLRIKLATNQANFACFFDPQISQMDTDFLKPRKTQKRTEEDAFPQNNSVPSVVPKALLWFPNGFAFASCKLPEIAHQISHKSSKFRLFFYPQISQMDTDFILFFY